MSSILQDQLAITLGIKQLDSKYKPPLVKADNPNISKEAQDFEVSRKAMLNVLNKADEHLDKVFATAESYQKPSGWEAAATFMKAVSDVAKDLKSLHEVDQGKHIRNPNEPQSPINVQNAVFVGTAAELIKELKKQTIIDVEQNK